MNDLVKKWYKVGLLEGLDTLYIKEIVAFGYEKTAKLMIDNKEYYSNIEDIVFTIIRNLLIKSAVIDIQKALDDIKTKYDKFRESFCESGFSRPYCK